MGSDKPRPVNLDLTTIRLPITAIASILHRLSGLFMFICTPWLLWMLAASLRSADSFSQVQAHLAGFLGKMALWLLLTAVIYHTLAGIRHLLMDCGIGEELPTGRFSAMLTISLTFVSAIILGVWLW